MSWITAIDYEQSEGRLRRIYDRIKGPDGYLDNILTVHGLRPHTLEGHMALYKNVLHNGANELDKWFLETIGVYVSLLNHCHYCVVHHTKGLERIVGDERTQEIQTALRSERFEDAFTPAEQAGLVYVRRLTRELADIEKHSVVALREAGFSDGQILEINQVASYFAYANRTVLGLGVSPEGDVPGLSPGGKGENDWGHR